MSHHPSPAIADHTDDHETNSTNESEPGRVASKPTEVVHETTSEVQMWLKDHHHQLELFLTLAGVITAVWIGIWAVREQNEVARRMAKQQNFMSFYQQWESQEMQEHRARLATSLLSSNNSGVIDDAPLVLLETLANATKLDLVDKDLAWTTFYIDVVSYWGAIENYASNVREEEKCSCIFRELEILSGEFRTMANAQGLSSSLIGTKESRTRFLEWERSRIVPTKETEEVAGKVPADDKQK